MMSLGSNQKKILLLLAGGVALGLSKSPRQYFKVVGKISNEWRQIRSQSLRRAIVGLYRSKLIDERDNPDGSVTMTITTKGKEKVITFNIDTMQIKKPQKWDGRWRLVLFDIPERYKKARDALHTTFERLGFCEYQKSVFIYPYECRDELNYIIEFFRLRPYVRIVIATELDNELHLKEKFQLSEFN